MEKHRFFIAGTDTDVGKTFVSQALLEAAKKVNFSCFALKPVAAGCTQTAAGLRNDDALKLMQASSVKLSYQQVNPIALEQAIAPHVAAKNENKNISLQRVVGFCRGAMLNKVDFLLVEGAGGWRVPLNSRETMAQIPKELSLPVILVVGIKLGCINHAMLTVEAILNDGVLLAGWVANHIDPQMSASAESVETLKSAIAAPLIGTIPYLPDRSVKNASEYLQIATIL
ncbi:MAG: dithiobiotin synthetase [Osedax symbiont Rs1]|nr:MAG: dithiobiotin synthetase [Osedax symbiont Rs1]